MAPGPRGCYLADVAGSSSWPGLLYVAIDGSGVYKSCDEGRTWQPINTGLGNLHCWTLAVDPIDPEVVYVGTWKEGRALFKTDNGGSDWYDITQEIYFDRAYDIAIDPNSNNILYVGSCGTLFKSEDHGQSWLPLTNNGEWELHRVWSIAIDRNSDNLYISTWGSTLNTIFRSTDGGNTWLESGSGLPQGIPTNSIAIDSDRPHILYAGTDSGVFKSTDNGKTWHSSSDGIENLFIRALAIDENNPNILYAATWGGLYQSIDSASTWKIVSAAFPNPCVKAISLYRYDSDTIYAGVYGGVAISHNRGINWDFCHEGFPAGTNVTQNALLIHPLAPQIMFLGTFGGGVARTTDGGESWHYVNNGLQMGCISALAMSASRSGTLYAGTDGAGVFKTTSYGDEWHQCKTGLTDYFVRAFAFDPQNDQVVHLATCPGYYQSEDEGTTWSAIDIGPVPAGAGGPRYKLKSIVIDPRDSDVIFVATRARGVLKSVDHGQSWHNISNGLADLRARTLVMDPTDPTILYVGGKGGLQKTVTAGESWFDASDGLPGAACVRTIVFDPSNTSILYVAVEDQGVFKSVDAGRTWLEWNNDLHEDVRAIAINPKDSSQIYAATGRGLFVWILAN